MLKQSPYPKIVILTGAGISAESGIATFRASGGLWENHRIEDVATPEAFARNPKKVHDFYNRRRRDALSVEIQPNDAHYALATLEKNWPGEVWIVTQNIDNLHQRAGSTNILAMHGSLFEVRSLCCGRVVSWERDLYIEDHCPDCQKQNCLRPNIVWFGEIPFHLPEISRKIQNCDLFVSIGTSGNVYPAAGFVQEARMHGRAHTLELNLEPSLGESFFHEKRYGPATTLVSGFVTELLQSLESRPTLSL